LKVYRVIIDLAGSVKARRPRFEPGLRARPAGSACRAR